LQRDVAVKVLPEGFARDAQRVARFQREAQDARRAESSEYHRILSSQAGAIGRAAPFPR
jgi:hypothetical protein